MALRFSGTEISSANHNSDNLASLKYNGNEVLSDWVEYTFPNSAAKCSSSNYLGIETAHSWPLYKILDNDSSTYQTGLSTDKLLADDKYKCGVITYKFPIEWDGVKITNVKLSGWVTYGVYTMCGSSNRDADPSASVSLSANAVFNTKLVYSSSVNTTHVVSSKNKVKAIRAVITRKSSNETTLTRAGEHQFTFLIKKSCLKAWLVKYNLPLPTDIFPEGA